MEFEQDIHNTAIVHPHAILHNNIKIGPYSIIGESVEIGEGTEVGNHVNITGHTRIGKSNKIYHYSSIGEQPQDIKYKDQETFLEIGDRNTIREFCTLNTGTVEGNVKTVIGNDNWIMAYVHVAHDCIIKNNIILANSVTLGGHVEIDDYVVLGGLTGVHQFCKVGSHSIVAAGSIVFQDIPPFIMAAGYSAKPNGINVEGLKRREFTAEDITIIKKGYKVIYRDGNSLQEATKILGTMVSESSLINLYLDFIKNSKRGIAR